ncbi:hypothetical protein CPT_Phriendly_012 [Vibrio phage Phriendly]|nr:hypothetical protein CPT_Phriendly_012 [Vibrio phage Phriendly]
MSFLDICLNILVGSITVMFVMLAILLLTIVGMSFYELFIKDKLCKS